MPLGQGYLLGRPAEPCSQLAPETVGRLRAGAARAQLVEHVTSLVESVPVEGSSPLPARQVCLRVDADGSPTALLLPRHREGDPDTHRAVPVSLRVSASTSVVELARRLSARPESCRFDPVVCVDDSGRARGIVRVEQVLLRLADLTSAEP